MRIRRSCIRVYLVVGGILIALGLSWSSFLAAPLTQQGATQGTTVYMPLISNKYGATQDATPVPTAPATSIQTMYYAASSAAILNPERGFHDNIDMVDETDLTWVRANGFTLARSYIRLDDYRNKPLPTDLLSRIERGFNAARAAGIKLIPRFSYNFGIGEEDAPVAQVEAHIAQLEPILRRHADVIAVMQAGFIGAWGEWHSSTHHLDSPENRALILGALLDSVPVTRMIELRYPGDLIAANPQPLTTAEAFSGSDRARTAHHNDCFLANEDDEGTYSPHERADEFKRYLDAITPFVAVGGETCQVTPEEARTDCTSTLADLERFHWDYLNAFFFEGAINRWKVEGCYDEIARRLGYRYRLIEASAPISAVAGSVAPISLNIANDGFGKLYNPRLAELILRSRAGGKQFSIVLNDHEDLRLWLPLAGEIKTITIMANLPASLPAGTYDLLLHLPDASATLQDNPYYAIQFANQDLWEADAGYNKLNLSIAISVAN